MLEEGDTAEYVMTVEYVSQSKGKYWLKSGASGKVTNSRDCATLSRNLQGFVESVIVEKISEIESD